MVTTHNFENYRQEEADNGDLVLYDSNDNEVTRWSVADEEWVFPAVNTDILNSGGPVSDGDGTERQIWLISNGASDPAGAGAEDIIFEEQA